MMNQWALLFDLDHTLCDDHELEKLVLIDLLRKYCSPDAYDKASFIPLSELQKGKVPLQKMLTETFVSGLRCTAPPIDELAREFRTEAVQRAKSQVARNQGTQKLFETLQMKKIKNAILSNGWTRLQKAKAEAIGYSGPLLTSEEIGAWKPDPIAFDRALNKLGFEKAATVYVGDSPETDVVGAKRAGLRVVWVNFSGTIYPENFEKPDATVCALGDLMFEFEKLRRSGIILKH